MRSFHCVISMLVFIIIHLTDAFIRSNVHFRKQGRTVLATTRGLRALHKNPVVK